MYRRVRQAWSDGLLQDRAPRRAHQIFGTRDELVDQSLDVGGCLVREVEIVIHITGESEMATILDAGKPPKQNDALSTEGLKTDGMCRAEYTPGWNAALHLNDLLPPHVKKPALDEPDHDVSSAVTPREATGPAR